ncbi:MAG: ATP synthase F1 subunit delta [Acidobacteriota bacterium]
MSLIAVARRYAAPLADVAIAHNKSDQIDSELAVFAEIIGTNRELFDLFASPVISQDSKREVLDAIIERTGPDKLTANLLRTLLRNYRLQYAGAVHEEFRREMNARKGILVAHVSTAAPVTPSQQESLGRRLSEMTGKQIQLEFKTDSSLIGGVVTRIGSMVYDGSVKTQLHEFEQRLKQGERA